MDMNSDLVTPYHWELLYGDLLKMSWDEVKAASSLLKREPDMEPNFKAAFDKLKDDYQACLDKDNKITHYPLIEQMPCYGE